MDEQFSQLVGSLQNATRPPTPEQLSELSDLGGPQLHALTEAWPSLSSDRRLYILQELRKLADEHFELTFETVNRMALQDQDARARQVAVENLWESQDAGLVRPVVEEGWLGSRAQAASQPVRQAVLASLGYSSRPEVADLIQQAYDTGQEG